MDCIQPKCVELQRICTKYRDLVDTRGVLISRYKDLQERMDKVPFKLKNYFRINNIFLNYLSLLKQHLDNVCFKIFSIM